MIGHIGFHSLPNPDYLQPYWPDGVELAYAIYPRYRRCGYGYEATAAMLRWAAHNAYVRYFLLSVAAENTASRGLNTTMSSSMPSASMCWMEKRCRSAQVRIPANLWRRGAIRR
jgi:hypothetical protein